MSRFHQLLLIGTFVPFCWLAMMAIHELGHVAALLGTGGSVRKVVLRPLAISRTDPGMNPRPVVVAWAGPVFGALAPLGLVELCRVAKLRGAYLARFFAGFSLIANGAYLGVGSFGRTGDAGEILSGAVPIWSLWLFGIVTAGFGLLLWHGLGPEFGLGKSAGRVDGRAAYVSCGLLLLTLVLELVLSPQ